MTNEEKLKQLLEIAIKNEWKPEFEDILYVDRINHTLLAFSWFEGERCYTSINDLISNWKKGEISFLDALCEAFIEVYSYKVDFEPFNLIFGDGKEIWIRTPNDLAPDIIRKYWVDRETENRLEWLFDTFKHLL